MADGLADLTISVVIPAYNRAGLIADAVRSVLNQTVPAKEIVVVDDGSSDGTAEAAEAAFHRWKSEKVGKLESQQRVAGEELSVEGSEEVPELKVIRQENAGPGIARNKGISAAKGEFVSFLDSDDLWYPWTIEIFRLAIASHREVSFVAGREVKVVHDAAPDRTNVEAMIPQNAGPSRDPVFKYYGNYLESFRDNIWIGTPAACIRKSALESVGGFSAKRMNAEDSDLWLKLGCARGFVRVQEPPLFIHRLTSGSEVSVGWQAVAGLRNLLESEASGAYPGGKAYRMHRMSIISRHVRPGCVNLLRSGHPREAWGVYRAALSINTALGKWKFLAGLPLTLVCRLITGRERAS